YVRIYAPRRKDAAQYKLVASFTPDSIPIPPDMTVPDPPKLPAIPEVCSPFDPAVKACETVWPESGAPPGWKACAEKDKADQKAEQERIAREEAEKARQERIKNAPK